MSVEEITPVKIQRYGWRKDRLDPRDFIFNNLSRVVRESQLPASVDLTSEEPPIYDQLQLGSCTANATGGIMEHRQMQEGEAEGAQTPSRLFIYYYERVIEGLPTDQDTGAEVRDGIKVLVKYGAPPESDWPYSDANPGPFQHQPNTQATADALKYEAVEYQRIIPGAPGAPIRSALAQGLPIAFGFQVPSEFEDPSWNPSEKYLPVPGPTTQFIGGHAVVIVGYDFSRQRFDRHVFKVRNSWGANWGESGHFYMDAAWFQPYRGVADDLWVVKKTT